MTAGGVALKLGQAALDPSQGWRTDSLDTNGTVLLAQLVPEPPSLALWGVGLALLGGVARRRAKAASAG